MADGGPTDARRSSDAPPSFDAPPPPDAAPPDAMSCTIAFVPPNVDFKSLDEGQVSGDQSVTIQNQGSVPTGVVTMSITGAMAAQYEITSNTCDGIVLSAGGGQCSVSVHFKPVGAGSRGADLTLTAGTCVQSEALTGVSVGIDGDPGCSDGSDCQSNHCVDGTCCDTDLASCSGCFACNVAGLEGTCSPVPPTTDPHLACSGAGPCGTGSCDGSGACGFLSGTVCQTDTTCTNSGASYSQFTGAGFPEHICTGTTDTCPASATALEACPGGNTCDSAGTACRTNCSSDLDCVFGDFCDSGTGKCTSSGGLGSSCDRQRECASYPTNFCANGTCQTNCTGGSCPNEPIDYCKVVAGGQNICTFCNTNPDCTNAGAGGTCNSSGECICGNDGECTNPSANHCILNEGNMQCGCYEFDPNFAADCQPTEVCVNPAATTDGDACRTRTGFLCEGSAQCVSGVCTNGICQ